MSRHDHVRRQAAWAVADQLERANELHHRAEQDRRAAMTPQQRAAVDHAREVEAATALGRRQAGQRAFTVALIGIIAAYALGAGVTVWLALPVLAAATWLTVWVYRARVAVLAAHLDELEGHDR